MSVPVTVFEPAKWIMVVTLCSGVDAGRTLIWSDDHKTESECLSRTGRVPTKENYIAICRQERGK